MIEKDVEKTNAIETFKHWVEYEKANKDKINKADELIQVQETVLKELETYKKIAEFLADEGEFNSNKYCDEDGLVCMVKHPERECTKCIVNWARNEVNKDVKD